jgi:ubiquitin-conjugating enzyme E2 D/E
MSTSIKKRLELEEKAMIMNPPESCAASPVDGRDRMKWRAAIVGPKGTPYEDGIFYITIRIPKDYPKRPPVLQFDTKIYHANISAKTGRVCVDILKTWSSKSTLQDVLAAIVSLLKRPNVNVDAGKMTAGDVLAYSPEIATQFKDDRATHDEKARECTERFATLDNKTPVVSPLDGEDWKSVAQRAAKEKTGWAVYNGKVLLGNSSIFYQQCVTLELGSPIPFNETSGWWEEGASDHWFNIPLNTLEIQNDIGMYVPGKLFTTRMPRALDLQIGEDWSKIKVPPGKTDKRRFIENVKDDSVTHVWVLVEDFEMAKVESKCLLDFYREQGVTVHHTPVPDFTVPSLEIERDNIEGLTIALSQGENCLVHCMGGTGRTGTVIIGAVQNLGINNAIKHCRKYGKSTYLEIKEQEEALEAQSKVLSERMLQVCPHLSMKIILDQLQELCEEQADGQFDVVDAADPITIEEAKVFTQLFNMVDLNGSDGITSVENFTRYLEQLVAINVLDVDAYTNITATQLQRLFAIIDPKVASASTEEDSITLATFLTVMNKKPKHTQGSKLAVSSKDLHHG